MSECGVSEIANSDLRESDVPPLQADWGAIQKFALTFDGYRHWGSFERCAEIANRREHDTLTKLRTCLFFEQRRWRHFGEEPDAEALAYIHEIIESIREKLRRGETE